MSEHSSTPATQLETLFQHLPALQPDTQPRWGAFTAQHMVEHLVGVFMISNGRFGATSAVPEEQWERRLAFLYDVSDFPRGIVNPLVQKGPLRQPDLAAAVGKLHEAFVTYQGYWAANPTASHMHPVFGPLNSEQWDLFHCKHITHHFRQFGLLPDAADNQ
jgi:oxepin-CoA hydrolase / 3-oxo-5,6-dehydrosuberyl-CoA semialdehyde dehydrogenase